MSRIRRRLRDRRKIGLRDLPTFDRDILHNGFMRGRPGTVITCEADAREIFEMNAAELSAASGAGQTLTWDEWVQKQNWKPQNHFRRSKV